MRAGQNGAPTAPQRPQRRARGLLNRMSAVAFEFLDSEMTDTTIPPPTPPKERRDLPLLSLLSVGTVLVTCIVLGYLGGRWLDGKWGTDPWFGVAGVVLGSLAGFLELFRTVSRTLK